MEHMPGISNMEGEEGKRMGGGKESKEVSGGRVQHPIVGKGWCLQTPPLSEGM